MRAHEDPEIPQGQRQPGRPSADRLLYRIAAVYGVATTDLCQPTHRPSEARQIAMYLLRNEAGLPLRTIARHFGVGYSVVSHRIRAVKAQLREDPLLRGRVERCKIKT